MSSDALCAVRNSHAKDVNRSHSCSNSYHHRFRRLHFLLHLRNCRRTSAPSLVRCSHGTDGPQSHSCSTFWRLSRALASADRTHGLYVHFGHSYSSSDLYYDRTIGCHNRHHLFHRHSHYYESHSRHGFGRHYVSASSYCLRQSRSPSRDVLSQTFPFEYCLT